MKYLYLIVFILLSCNKFTEGEEKTFNSKVRYSKTCGYYSKPSKSKVTQDSIFKERGIKSRKMPFIYS